MLNVESITLLLKLKNWILNISESLVYSLYSFEIINKVIYIFDTDLVWRM